MSENKENNMQNKKTINNESSSSVSSSKKPPKHPYAKGYNPNLKAYVKNPKQQINKEVAKRGIVSAVNAMTYGRGGAFANRYLETEEGQEILDRAAAENDNPAEATKAAAKEIVKKQTTRAVIIGILSTAFIIVFIVMFIAILLGKNPDVGMGGNTDENPEFIALREKVNEVRAKYMLNYRVAIDGNLIMATLIGYHESEMYTEDKQNETETIIEEDQTGNTTSKEVSVMMSKIELLAKYQIMTTIDGGCNSSTVRKIASNDDNDIIDMLKSPVDKEKNYKCIPGTQTPTYKLSIERGDYNDDNSGGVYYWNLIDGDFITDYYGEYISDETEDEKRKTIHKIVEDIYDYYETFEYEEEDIYQAYENNQFWWPIGSSETEEIDGKLFAKGNPSCTNITSHFGSTEEIRNGTAHGGLDIACGGTHYAIATKAGTVIYPTDTSQTQYPNVRDDNAGGGYGNYVIIDHGNSEYTLYAHMQPNSIPVKAGDSVQQGQVIGIMGTSGFSTGQHLHFEIRIGGNDRINKVDPEEYVDPNNPRPSGSSFKEWIISMEGGVSGKYVDGDNYVVYDGGDRVLTVGYGIVIVNQYGQQNYKDIYNKPVTVGSRIPKGIVDQMFDKFMEGSRNALNNAITNNNVVLKQHQYDAILSFMYNLGDGYADNLVKAAKQGNEAYWDYSSQFTHATINDVFQELPGLKNRRADEYELFLKGDYKYDPLYNGTYKYYDVQEW